MINNKTMIYWAIVMAVALVGAVILSINKAVAVDNVNYIGIVSQTGSPSAKNYRCGRYCEVLQG